MEWYQDSGVLLYQDKITDETVDRKTFFKERYKEGINKSRCNLDFEPLTFHNFKLISILDSARVKVHFVFKHAKYGHNYQRIYFSDDRELMLERLQNHLVFLYRREVVNQSTGEVTWNIVKRLEQFCTDLSDYSYFNYLFTPDLKLYIDFSKADNKFMIRNSFDQSIHLDIPQGTLAPKVENPEQIGKRFMFVSNDTFRLIN
jgi:hypothetical protein